MAVEDDDHRGEPRGFRQKMLRRAKCEYFTAAKQAAAIAAAQSAIFPSEPKMAAGAEACRSVREKSKIAPPKLK